MLWIFCASLVSLLLVLWISCDLVGSLVSLFMVVWISCDFVDLLWVFDGLVHPL